MLHVILVRRHRIIISIWRDIARNWASSIYCILIWIRWSGASGTTLQQMQVSVVWWGPTWWHIEGALCSFGEEIQTQIFNIDSVYEDIKKNNSDLYFVYKWTNKLFSEENKVPAHCLKLYRWQGPPNRNTAKRYKLCCPLRSVCSVMKTKRVWLFSLVRQKKNQPVRIFLCTFTFLQQSRDCSFNL